MRQALAGAGYSIRGAARILKVPQESLRRWVESCRVRKAVETAGRGVGGASADAFGIPFKEAKLRVVAEFERGYVEAALARTGGNILRAAEESGIDRKYFKKLVREYGIAIKE